MAILRKVSIDTIRIPEVRVSSILNEEQRALMASTIKEIGVIQDPVVRPYHSGGYELISGRSRIQELANQGATDVQVKVIEADEKTGLVMNIVENIARGSYDYVSISRSIKRLRALGASMEELERVFPWKRRWIEFLEGLNDLPEDVVEAISTRKITPTHVQLALNLPSPHEVHSGLRTAITHGWNTGVFKTFVENRVEQVARARQEASAKGVTPVIPEVNPQQLIQYKQCLLCGFTKPSEQVLVQMVCDDCKNIANYVTANLGSDEDAIQTLYAALQAYYGTRAGPRAKSQEPRLVDVQA